MLRNSAIRYFFYKVPLLPYLCDITTVHLKHLYILCTHFVFTEYFARDQCQLTIILYALVSFLARENGIRLRETYFVQNIWFLVYVNNVLKKTFSLQDVEQGTSSIKVILLDRYTKVVVQICLEIVSKIFCRKSQVNLSVMVCCC